MANIRQSYERKISLFFWLKVYIVSSSLSRTQRTSVTKTYYVDNLAPSYCCPIVSVRSLICCFNGVDNLKLCASGCRIDDLISRWRSFQPLMGWTLTSRRITLSTQIRLCLCRHQFVWWFGSWTARTVMHKY